jgi:hypothetical protein
MTDERPTRDPRTIDARPARDDARSTPSGSASSACKTKREAVRALKRRISDAIFRQLLHDAVITGPGGQRGRLWNTA